MTQDFQVYFLNYEQETEQFSRDHQALMKCIPTLVEVTDNLFRQLKVSTDDRLGLVISQLARVCNRHLEGIILLATTGHGYSAARLLRSLFEKAVDAKYLHQSPNEVEDFIDYYLVQQKLQRGEDVDFEMPVNHERFLDKNQRLRPRWSKKHVNKKAEAVGLDYFTNNTYKHGHLFIHSSMHEVLASFILEDDGSISPATSSQHREHKMAFAGMLSGITIMLNVLDLLVEHFRLSAPPELEEFTKCFIEGVKATTT